MTYSPTYYQPSILELARQGNFRAIAYWINSILAPQGIHIQAEAGRSGRLTIMVYFPPTRHSQSCVKARQQLVRHICYRLWTLNSKSIREVRIMARVNGQREILWRQSVRISTPANTGQPPRRHIVPATRAKNRSAKQERFQVLRSFLLNRLAIAGFLFCYWVIYLETTGFQTVEQPVITTAQAQTQAQKGNNTPPKTAIVAPRPQPQNQVFTVPAQFQGQVVYEVTPPATAEKVVALTFDDGPWKETTEQILNILKQNNIKSTFFFVGQALQENPTLAKKVVEQGHVVGNHTWSHPMNDIDLQTAAQELGNTARLIYEATGGVRTYLMRPPAGNLSGELANYAKQQGYMVTMWSADSRDYLVSSPLIVDNVLSQVKPGGIVLMHDGGGDRSATVEALPQVISALRSQGYKFVTLPELMALQAKWTAPRSPVSTPGINSPSALPNATPNTAPAPDPNFPATPQTTIENPTQPLQPIQTQPIQTQPIETQPIQAQPNEQPVNSQPGSPDPAIAPAPSGPGSPNAENPVNPAPVLQGNSTTPTSPSPLIQDNGAVPMPTHTETALGYAP